MKNNGNLSKKGCIRAERLKFRYFEKSKRNILDDVSIEFPGEKVTVILGSSGCGKSTLASVICGEKAERTSKN